MNNPMKTKLSNLTVHPNVNFGVVKYSINLATSESGTDTGLHRLPSISVEGSDSAGLKTGIIVFVPSGQSVPAPNFDHTRGILYLYYLQEVYAAMIDLLGRAMSVECKAEWDSNLNRYWASLACPSISR